MTVTAVMLNVNYWTLNMLRSFFQWIVWSVRQWSRIASSVLKLWRHRHANLSSYDSSIKPFLISTLEWRSRFDWHWLQLLSIALTAVTIDCTDCCYYRLHWLQLLSIALTAVTIDCTDRPSQTVFFPVKDSLENTRTHDTLDRPARTRGRTIQ